jgi:hypothetical protein
MPNASQPGGNGAPAPKTNRPAVTHVYYLDSENVSECPGDQNHLIQMQADLDYSRDFQGGSIVSCPLLLRFCPSCRKWYIDWQRLQSLVRQGINPRGFDIIASAAYPRPAAYAQWHPEAAAAPAGAARPAAARKRPDLPAKALPAASPRMTDRNLAFRCRYCDGGQTGRSLGFRGICSQACYYMNVVDNQDAWCSGPDNRCQALRPEAFAQDVNRCCESHLLSDWNCIAGFRYKDSQKIPVRLVGDHSGAIALATTVLPRESEANRRIFAIFLIGSQSEQDGSTSFTADAKLRVELLSDEPLHFWKFFPGKGPAEDYRWGSEPCRPVSQEIMVQILQKAARLIKDTDRRIIAERLLSLAESRIKPGSAKPRT